MLTLATTAQARPYVPMPSKPKTNERGTTQLGRALKVLRLRAQLTQAHAAEAFGVTTQAWQNYEGGKRPSIFRVEELDRLALAVNSSSELLLRMSHLLAEGRSEGMLSDPSVDIEGDPVSFRTATSDGGRPALTKPDMPAPDLGLVPVYGIAMAGPSDAVVFTPDHPDDWMPPHPNQVGRPGAFYVRIKGDSVYPRFESGELAPAVRNKPPKKGQVCVIETVDDAMLVKFYQGDEQDGVRLLELQPERREFVLEWAKVRAIHAVVGGAV